MMRQNPVAATVTDRTKRAPLLPRQRLFALLDEWRSLPMLWIGGPPGAGKTALVASYLEARQLPSVWHHLDEEDIDPEMFLQHLAALVGGSAVFCLSLLCRPRFDRRISAVRPSAKKPNIIDASLRGNPSKPRQKQI